jgi:hypothetical protein
MTAPTAPPYNVNNVLVGPAALYIAPANTPLPADSSILFDPANWTGKTLTANGATAVTLMVTNAAGSQSTASLTSFATITAAAVQTALAALTNVGAGKVTVTGSAGGPFQIVFANSLGPVTLTVPTSTGGTGPTVTGGLWTPPGATEAGWTFGKTISTQDINIEEQGPPVGRFVTSSGYGISGTVMESSRANWKMALNALRTLVAAGAGGSGQPGVDVLTMQDDLIHYAVALETKNEYGYATRDYIPDAVQAENITVAHRRAATAKGLAVNFASVCDVKLIQSRGITTATP